jgi:hypothetical protein
MKNIFLSPAKAFTFMGVASGILFILLVQLLNHNVVESGKRKDTEQMNLLSQETNCRSSFTRSQSLVLNSPSLFKLVTQKVDNPRFSRAAPGFRPDSDYIWIRTNSASLFPPNTVIYGNDFFKDLSESKSIFIDGLSLTNSNVLPPVIVSLQSIDVFRNQAVVSSLCTDKQFSVDLKDLYEIFQTIDFE